MYVEELYDLSSRVKPLEDPSHILCLQRIIEIDDKTITKATIEEQNHDNMTGSNSYGCGQAGAHELSPETILLLIRFYEENINMKYPIFISGELNSLIQGFTAGTQSSIESALVFLILSLSAICGNFLFKEEYLAGAISMLQHGGDEISLCSLRAYIVGSIYLKETAQLSRSRLCLNHAAQILMEFLPSDDCRIQTAYWTQQDLESALAATDPPPPQFVLDTWQQSVPVPKVFLSPYEATIW
ncbi:hypothetical protein B0O99DRAFT_645077 [Bisporella sp. PMI_857]|nr:hypothetical protein B0O99DRAFT_645077 [Bisporella sp. PMI_857]